MLSINFGWNSSCHHSHLLSFDSDPIKVQKAILRRDILDLVKADRNWTSFSSLTGLSIFWANQRLNSSFFDVCFKTPTMSPTLPFSSFFLLCCGRNFCPFWSSASSQSDPMFQFLSCSTSSADMPGKKKEIKVLRSLTPNKGWWDLIEQRITYSPLTQRSWVRIDSIVDKINLQWNSLLLRFLEEVMKFTEYSRHRLYKIKRPHLL